MDTDSVRFKIEEVSSEDKNNPSTNLTNGKPWISASSVPEVHLVLKLDKPCQIQSIVVHNNFSGLLEVFGREQSLDVWKSIIGKSSLMTPNDSRNAVNGTTERQLQLSPNSVNFVFEAVKFVCQQPFNRSLCYGLSKIQIVPVKQLQNGSSKSAPIVLKKKEKSSEIKVGDLFSISSKPHGGTGSSIVIPTGESDTSSVSLSSQVSENVAKQNENSAKDPGAVTSKSSQARASPDSEDDMPSTSKGKGRKGKHTGERHKRKTEKDSEDDDKSKEEHAKGKFKTKHAKRKNKELREDDDDVDESSRKKTRRDSKKEKLRDVMKGVIFALSGFVNPERSELREKACDMGAKYRSDWTADCTHLICAFANTPKFSQVRSAGGKIVRKEWINDCLSNKRMQPWRNYMLKPAKSAVADEDDGDDEMEEAKFNEDEEWEPDAESSAGEEESSDESEEVLSEELESDESGEKDEDISGIEDEDEEDEGSVSSRGKKKAALPKGKKGRNKKPTPKKKPSKRKGKGKHFDSDSEDSEELNLTDSEEPDIDDTKFVPRQLALLRGKHFFLFGEFTANEEKKLRETIINLSGSLREYNDEKVTHCVTNSNWSDDFDEALVENPNLVVVTSEWVYDCEKQRALPDPKKYKPKK